MKKTGDKKDKRKEPFKEWVSDSLRYFMILLAAALIVCLILSGIRIYQGSRQQKVSDGQDGQDAIVILENESEKQTESEPQTEPEKQSGQSEMGLTAEEKQTEEALQSDTVPSSSEPSDSLPSEQIPQVSVQAEPESVQAEPESVQAEPESVQAEPENVQTEPEIVQTEPEIVQTEPEIVQTEPEVVQTEPPQPVYLTMTGACYIRSEADYGDNIIGEYPAGTVVKFLEDVGGWYKVQIDGMTGYMGARFFQ